MPPVIDAGDVLRDPQANAAIVVRCDRRRVLRCDAVVAPGLRQTDGVWAKYWYAEVRTLNRVRTVSRKKESDCRNSLRRSTTVAARCYERALSYIDCIELGTTRISRRSNCRAGASPAVLHWQPGAVALPNIRVSPRNPRFKTCFRNSTRRNRDLIVNINGQLIHRDKAGISPFDSAVQGGDAVWEGLRLYRGRIFKLHEHLDRLHRSATALSFAEIPPREKIIDEIKRTLAANEMQ